MSEFIAVAEACREDPKNTELRNRVAEAAGRAAGASTISGLRAVNKMPFRGRIDYDPIAAWDAQLDPWTDQLQEAIAYAYQIRGTLEEMADVAARQERSVVGWVARFVGFPGRVATYLRDRQFSRGAQTAGFLMSISIQVTVGLLVAWIVYLVGWAGG